MGYAEYTGVCDTVSPYWGLPNQYEFLNAAGVLIKGRTGMNQGGCASFGKFGVMTGGAWDSPIMSDLTHEFSHSAFDLSDEYRDMDPMLCSGTNCPPYPHAIDFHLHIHMLAGTAFYELTDTISGKPPIRLDLRGHVQLFCMNAPCELDVCKPLSLDAGKPDLSDLDGGTSARDVDVER